LENSTNFSLTGWIFILVSAWSGESSGELETWERRGENLDNQAFHGLIIKFFDNQTVSLP
jgi:hypothetical protein